MTRTDIDESDYFRQLLRDPQLADSPGAKLVQLKLVAQLLDDMRLNTPKTAIAICSMSGGKDLVSTYGTSGHYESSYEKALPHSVQFAEFLQASDAPVWCKDLIRVELWQGCSDASPELMESIKAIVQAHDHKDGMTYLIVGSNVPATIRTIDGYLETSIWKAGTFLWMLGFDPVKLIVEVEAKPGIMLFSPEDDSEGSNIRYIADEE